MASVRIPADVDREDVLLAGMTARQLGLASAGALILAGLWAASKTVVPAPLFLALASPVAAVFAVVALGRRDGVSADRLLFAWLRHALGSRRLVPAPEGVPALPAGVDGPPPPAALRLPVEAVHDGVLDLGGDGLAAVCRVASLNFGLRTEAEQEAIVASFARWLNSLSGPVQVVVRAERVDVAALVESLASAEGLPHAALAEAARDHAAFLSDLASRRDVLRRVVLLVLREPAGPGAADLLRRRVDDAVSALSGAGVSVSPLSDEDAVAALASAADPDARRCPPGLALPGQTITRRAE
ncbi:MAG: hypothetical protein QOK43_2886 [Acidimicrobiaceae bacterium]|nr:hypothetical protein [Acidimicrobiaceae bacterium]